MALLAHEPATSSQANYLEYLVEHWILMPASSLNKQHFIIREMRSTHLYSAHIALCEIQVCEHCYDIAVRDQG